MATLTTRSVEDILKTIIGDQAVLIARLQVIVDRIPGLQTELEELRARVADVQAPPAPET
jgi:hypothetical protein